MSKKTLKVKVIGCGGVGLCVLNVLPRWLSYQNTYEVELTVIDGDSYEEKNRARQSFVQLGNKAEVTANQLRDQFGNFLPWIVGTPSYLTEDNIYMLIREDDIIFSCVDNHATRKLISDRAEDLKNVVVISGGNEFTDGNCQIHIRNNNKNITLPVANKYHPEIQNPEDKNPGIRTGGCAQVVESQPQLLFTNNFVSAIMLNAFYSYIEGNWDKEKPYDEVYCDVLTNKVRPVPRKN